MRSSHGTTDSSPGNDSEGSFPKICDTDHTRHENELARARHTSLALRASCVVALATQSTPNDSNLDGGESFLRDQEWSAATFLTADSTLCLAAERKLQHACQASTVTPELRRIEQPKGSKG